MMHGQKNVKLHES